MANTLQEKFNLGIKGTGEAIDTDLDTRPEDYTAFRIDPQVHPSNALIDFWQSDGNQRAIAYTHLYDNAWNRSAGMVLTFSEHQVSIQGTNLEQLYRALKRHRIVFVWEASSQEAISIAEGEAVVRSIVIGPRQQPVDLN